MSVFIHVSDIGQQDEISLTLSPSRPLGDTAMDEETEQFFLGLAVVRLLRPA